MARKINDKEPTVNHKLKAFNLGKIISEEHKSKGNKRFPNPPINNGMIIKKIINKP
jgi:hypothetical protein